MVYGLVKAAAVWGVGLSASLPAAALPVAAIAVVVNAVGVWASDRLVPGFVASGSRGRAPLLLSLGDVLIWCAVRYTLNAG